MTWRPDRPPFDSAGEDPEVEAKTQENQPLTVEETPSDPLSELQAELAAARSEAELWKDRYLRKAAEFDNFRKRMERDKAESMILAKSAVLTEILHVVDACERALISFPQTGSEAETLDQYREGVKLLFKQLIDTLARLGVVPIEALGERFDPHLHEALIHEAHPEFEENTVIRELRRGYLYNDRLLRPVQVKVAVRPQEKEAEPTNPDTA